MLRSHFVLLAPLHQGKGRPNIAHRTAAALLEVDDDGEPCGHTGGSPTLFLSKNERQHLVDPLGEHIHETTNTNVC